MLPPPANPKQQFHIYNFSYSKQLNLTDVNLTESWLKNLLR